MKNKQIKTVTLLVVFSCSIAQSLFSQRNIDIHTITQKEKPMQRFDITPFEENKITHERSYSKDGKKHTMYSNKDFYTENIESESTGFRQQIVYYKKTLTPQRIVNSFSNCIIDTIYHYDLQGNVTAAIDQNADFKLSIYDVRDMILKEYGIDLFLLDGGNTLMDRSPNPYAHYMFRFRDKDNNVIFYSISADDGYIIVKSINGINVIKNPHPEFNERTKQRIKEKEAEQKAKEQANKKSWIDKLLG